MKEQEIWKPVRGYEEYLEVSNLGNVKLLERVANSVSGGRVIPERILPVRISKAGKYEYPRLDITLDNKSISITVSKVVYEAFNNIRLDTKKVVAHKDGNRLNNRIDNLCVLTRRNVRSSATGKSGYVGVHSKNNRKRYESVIHFEGRQICIHTSEDKEECRKVYELAKAMIDEYDKLKAGILSNSRLNNKLIVKSLPIK